MKQSKDENAAIQYNDGPYKMTYFKTKNGKDWMPGERYKVVISPVSERVKSPKGFTKISEWTQEFYISESNYDFTDDMKSGYMTFQGDIGYFPPTHFISPKPSGEEQG